jgi:chemotaxis protein histidine kinase CheA/ActR/RegA family two-component response regulator
MNSEQQQQRIMSYFIEEAQEHLQTIEQGVLDLQGVLADVERINELFRAAHSIKGGAAMLDLGSIQHISHRFEDYFKILKDNTRVEVDEKLKSLFLAGCDRLHELLDYLQENYTISKELADAKVAEVEPVFSDLELHLNGLVAGVTAIEDDTFMREQRAERHAYEDMMVAFQAGVADELRNMLQLFKQEDTQATRQQLQGVCDRLSLLGENLEISDWQEMISTSKLAISNVTNPYLTLAQVIIRDIRQSQDLVLAQRSQEISVSEQLRALTDSKESMAIDDQSMDTFWEDQGMEEELSGSLDAAFEIEEDEFLLGEEMESAELTDDFGLELSGGVNDFSDGLEAIDEDSDFDWGAVESDTPFNENMSGADLGIEPEFSDLFAEVDTSVEQTDDGFSESFGGTNSILQEDVDATFDLSPMDIDGIDELAINEDSSYTPSSDIGADGEYDLDQEFDMVETGETYDPDILDINNSIDDTNILESTSDFDGEFDFNEDIKPAYNEDFGTETDQFDYDSGNDDFAPLNQNDQNEWDMRDSTNLFESVAFNDEYSEVKVEEIDPFAAAAELGTLDSDFSADDKGFTDPFSLDNSSLDNSLDDEPDLSVESLDLPSNNLDDSSVTASFDSNVSSVLDLPEEMFEENQEDSQGFGVIDSDSDVGNQLTVSDAIDNIDNEVSWQEVPKSEDVALNVVEELSQEGVPESELISLDNASTDLISDSSLVGQDTKIGDELSTVFAVDELFELEALGFDLDDAEEEESFALQGLAASELIYPVSATEPSELAQAEEKVPDGNLEMSDFFSEEANELLAPVTESENVELSASDVNLPSMQSDGEGDSLQLADLDLDENLFSLDTATTDVTDGSPELTLDEILGAQSDWEAQPDQASDAGIADLFAVQGSDESALQIDIAEIEDFSDFLATVEVPELTSDNAADTNSNQLNLTTVLQPQLEDDASVLDDLMLEEAETTSNDVDLDNLFADSNNSQSNEVSDDSGHGSEEILAFESLDISQDSDQAANYEDFSELLDLGFESNEPLPVEKSQVVAQEFNEQLMVGNTEEQVEAVNFGDLEVIVSNVPDVSESEDTAFQGEDDPETAFLDDIEDLVKHRSDSDSFALTNENLRLEDSSDPDHEIKELDTVLQDQEVAEITSLSQELTAEPSDRYFNNSVIQEDSPENLDLDEATNQVTDSNDSISEDELQLEDLLVQVNQADQQSLDEMISEAAFSDSAPQEFDQAPQGFNSADFSNLSDPSDTDDEFSSIWGFIETDPDLGNETDESSEFSEAFGLTDTDSTNFPEADSESDEGDDGVPKPQDKQPTPINPSNDIDPTGGEIGEHRPGDHNSPSDSVQRDISEITEDTSSKVNTWGNTMDSASNFASVPEKENLPTPDHGDNSGDNWGGLEIFDELEALLVTPIASIPAMPSLPMVNKVASANSSSVGDFDDLEALLASPASKSRETASSSGRTKNTKKVETDEFDELEMLLRDTYGKDVGPVNTKTVKRQALAKRAVSKIVTQTMKVDVKHLDSLNNLVGELVVNRNLLEQDQEKLQQFIGNLLFKVQQLGDVAQRMRDQYDRSLLETSIMASRPKSFAASAMVGGYAGSDHNGTVTETFEDIEFDRYNSFHILSQEIIELVVRVRESASDIEFVVDETEQVSRQLGTITTQIQDDLKQVRMVPFAQIADRLPRAVRDLSFKTGKQADIEMHGRETLIDKAILEQLYDPMTHLVNNAIVHGLEDPATRQADGKPSLGKIVVRAFHQGNQTVISISDDGAGINTDKVKQSAVSKGLYTQSEVAQLSELETYDLLFEAGFSTKSQADELAGRGVGLDVVRTAINDIRGSMHTDSSVGKGTTFTIRLPLTLSISKAMFCISDRVRIAFPVDGFEDVIEISQAQVQLNSNGQPCLPWRDTILPFQPLSNLLAYNRHINRGNIYGKQDDDVISVIILRSEGNYLALQVDQFLGENEIVIKQLEGPMPKPAGIAGATILGDGKVMSIANVLELFDIAAGRLRPSTTSVPIQPMEDDKPANDPTVLIVDDSITVRELLSLTFSKVGYRVEQARDGQDAWEKLRAGLPCNLIFCDIEMPRMDGLELLSRLQKDEFLSQIPVAMLTSRGADRYRQTAAQLGAKGYFTKPYLEEEVLSGSQKMLNGEVLI